MAADSEEDVAKERATAYYHPRGKLTMTSRG